jgi:hypothetical protein
MRPQVTALACQLPAPRPEAAHAPHVPERSPARTLWALLLVRIYEVLPLRCSLCGGEMRIIAFVTDRPAIHSILSSLGEPTAPPQVAAARGPPLWEQAARLHWDDTPAPVPSVRVRPAVSW